MANVPNEDTKENLSRDLIQALDDIFGLHPGHRPAHAKGIILSGVFTPAPDAASLTRAPHIHHESTPVSVRFSNSGGLPDMPDNDANGASPRGCAIRFHLAEHVHTDIIAHSHNGFPVRTPEQFLEFLRAVTASAGATERPTPVEAFLGAHPSALRFVQTPKPVPSSFARETHFGVNAFRFTNGEGVSRYGRYRIIPEQGDEHLSGEEASAKSSNFLFDEIVERIAENPVRLRIVVQLAEPGDAVDDATDIWPEDRTQIDFGAIVLNARVADDDRAARRMIFDPIPRVDGIEPSDDPLLETRAEVYLISGRRRRAADEQ
ncbi:MAG: catalase family peroxidase [Acidobacteria bacterium]|nr:catalase family peroxidase [Acidobacteriota bacterium]MCW5967938.1 catalase family peroxidase [Blastocatellales bacterium]